MTIETLYEDTFVDVKGDPAQLERAARIVFSFTGGGLNEERVRTQALEFVGTAMKLGGAIFITDKTRSWGNSVDFDKVREAIARYVDGKPMVSVGNSMGGFLSVLSTSLFPVDVAIGFGAQYTANPELIPEEQRWRRYRTAITDWTYEVLGPHIHPDRRYYLFYGEFEPDMRHCRSFPSSPGLYRYVFPGKRHNVANYMKKCGELGNVIEACINGTFSLDEADARLRRGGPYLYEDRHGETVALMPAAEASS